MDYCTYDQTLEEIRGHMRAVRGWPTFVPGTGYVFHASEMCSSSDSFSQMFTDEVRSPMKYGKLKWTIVADLFVAHATAGPMQDTVWELFVKDLKTKPFTKCLVTTRGTVEVSSVQRKSGSEALTSRNILTAVVTDERLVRGIVTAASWLGVNIKSFSWAELHECLKHLRVPSENEDRVLDALNNLRVSCEQSH